MSEDNLVPTRRRVLQGATSALALSATAGVGTATELVDVNVGYNNERGRQAAKQAADRINREFNFDAVAIRAAPQAVDALERNPAIRYVEENGKMWPVGQTVPYGVTTVEADVTISDGQTGSGISVGILDTGVDPTHEDLADNMGQGIDCGGGDCTESVADDDRSHGTHIAGIVGAVDNEVGVLGVAPEVTLHSVKVLGDDGGTFETVAAGIEASADAGHSVQNMSFGGGDSSLVRDAMQYAADKGVVMVAAAGNGSCEDCVIFPASAAETIAVSATDQNDELAEFSSTGPEIELAAPGVDCLSTVPGDSYGYASGTSMAAPHVSAAAAVLMAAGLADPEEVRSRLVDSADDIGLADHQQGGGRLNVASALETTDSPDETVTVETTEPRDIESTSAILTGELTVLDGTDTAEVSFEYGPSGESRSTTATQTVDSTGSFTELVDGLDPETDYEFRAVAETAAATDAGSLLSFTTASETDSEPTEPTDPVIEQWSVGTRTTGPWFRATSTWAVSDDDAALDSVTTELREGGSVVDRETTNVSGGTASGDHSLRTRGGADEIRLTVTDEDGRAATESRSL